MGHPVACKGVVLAALSAMALMPGDALANGSVAAPAQRMTGTPAIPSPAALSVAPPASATAARTGQEIYELACQSCHSTGFPKAPQLGDKRAWRPLIREGVKHLSDEVMRGRGAMPAKGGRSELTRADIERAVAYMGRQAGANWRQP